MGRLCLEQTGIRGLLFPWWSPRRPRDLGAARVRHVAFLTIFSVQARTCHGHRRRRGVQFWRSRPAQGAGHGPGGGSSPLISGLPQLSHHVLRGPVGGPVGPGESIGRRRLDQKGVGGSEWGVRHLARERLHFRSSAWREIPERDPGRSGPRESSAARCHDGVGRDNRFDLFCVHTVKGPRISLFAPGSNASGECLWNRPPQRISSAFSARFLTPPEDFV